MTGRRRLDAELVRRGLATSRDHARQLVGAGSVLVAGAPAAKVDRLVAAGEPVVVLGPPPRFVSRGGDKLDAALERFGIVVEGRRCLDAGASTGGFTDCLVQRGAASVVALDVGHGQLHPRIREHPRVEVLERVNLRDVGPGALGAPFGLVVADLSFISLTVVSATLVALAADGADLVVLVKPQFEAGRAEVSRAKGVIRDPDVWRRALGATARAFAAAGAPAVDACRSPIRGGAGNVEFPLHLRRGAVAATAALDLGALTES
ncbi:MAG: TlyA family rRNA (cytidine-2'-O)-methyltransferase [Acidimicrobiia bacterium]|nr:TlyA family rRNA (cytidine-2'-O)-methyltransferase [Acidimicrobiia bacterium]